MARRLTYDEATSNLMLAATALSTLKDPTAPESVRKIATKVDEAVGVWTSLLTLARQSGRDSDRAVGELTGGIRIVLMYGACAALKAMPEAQPYRSSVNLLSDALGAFTKEAR